MGTTSALLFPRHYDWVKFL